VLPGGQERQHSNTVSAAAGSGGWRRLAAMAGSDGWQQVAAGWGVQGCRSVGRDTGWHSQQDGELVVAFVECVDVT
jgi:hypothetical protein